MLYNVNPIVVRLRDIAAQQVAFGDTVKILPLFGVGLYPSPRRRPVGSVIYTQPSSTHPSLPSKFCESRSRTSPPPLLPRDWRQRGQIRLGHVGRAHLYFTPVGQLGTIIFIDVALVTTATEFFARATARSRHPRHVPRSRTRRSFRDARSHPYLRARTEIWPARGRICAPDRCTQLTAPATVGGYLRKENLGI